MALFRHPIYVYAHRYQGYLTKAFVEDSLALQWCPHDGCSLVVKKPPHIRRQKPTTDTEKSGRIKEEEAEAHP